MCVSVALGTQQAKRMSFFMLTSVTCATVPYFSTLSHKRHDFRGKNVIENKVFFVFYSVFVKYLYFFLRRTERQMVIMCISLHVKYPFFLSDFN